MALLSQRVKPFGLDRAMTGARLPAGDQPMDVGEVKPLQRTEQWLSRDEAHRGVDPLPPICALAPYQGKNMMIKSAKALPPAIRSPILSAARFI